MGFLAAGIGALAGGIAGAIKKPGLGAETELEQNARNATQAQFKSLQDVLSAGPGKRDFFRGIQSQRDLAAQLGQLSQSGGLPTEADITRTRGISDLLFQGQREAQNQSFQQQEVNASRRAALSGRSITDPVLQNQLAQQQTLQSRQLSAEQGSFATQLALQQPLQQLQFAAQRADVLGGLGQQAIQNRQSLLGLGQQISASEFDRRQAMMQAERSRGGGFGGALTGAIGGAGAGMGIAGGLQNLSQSSQRFASQQALTRAQTGAFNRFGTQPFQPQAQTFQSNPFEFSPAQGPFQPMTPSGASGVINSPFTGNVDLFNMQGLNFRR